MAIAPDGPTGPSLKSKPGIILLARDSGMPIILELCVEKRVAAENLGPSPHSQTLQPDSQNFWRTFDGSEKLGTRIDS